jgi:hypothetical protein
MIKYKLICKDCNFLFDSWFASSKEYEKLKKKKYIDCHHCGSMSVEKTLMSPSVLKSNKELKVEMKDERYKDIRKKINEYQKFIEKNFEFVGENFAYEARSIHYKNKKKSKGIYGSASKEELSELKEEGIEAEIIPWLKDNSN